MVDKKGEKPQTTRIAANKLLLDFLKENNLVIIADETLLVNNIEPGVIYTVDKRPRIRVYYKDQIEKEQPKIDGDNTPKVEVVN